MPRRLPHIHAELTGRLAAIEIARAQLFDVDADRKKRIDRLIDYFGTPLSPSGSSTAVSNFEQI